MSELTDVTQQLRQARLDAGETIAAVARRVGIGHPMLSYAERNWRRPSADVLFAWAGALGYDLVLMPSPPPGYNLVLDVVLVPAAGNDCKVHQSVHADATTATRDGGR